MSVQQNVGDCDDYGEFLQSDSIMVSVLESKLLTAEEYGNLPDDGRLTELVRGRIVEMNRPFTSNGYHIVNIWTLLSQFVKYHGLGRVVGGDTGVITQHDPDSVRGPDLAFYSYERIPAGCPINIGRPARNSYLKFVHPAISGRIFSKRWLSI